MKDETLRCERACRDTCSTLNDAFHQETALVHLYEQILSNCDDPEIKQFTRELAEVHGAAALGIMQKLNEIRARSHAIDGVMASFEGQ
ncbi:MAG: hypothetical protein NTV54_12255 [Ignavibacteriales bacterium]|nr:hypothetical protein [Ignavibacteriales bacterium]